ncbi:AAA family ATPase [Cetobacterium sp.]|uniref:AAA family ATPase n=1 Tax=Cetobacterium sp. TaxID=2071632 RepID=UPI003EE4785D
MIELNETQELLEKLNINEIVSSDQIDGLLIKKMAESNILKENRRRQNTGKQTHIALTSKERSLFPIVTTLSYSEDEVEKKFYDIKLKLKLYQNNIKELEESCGKRLFDTSEFYDGYIETYTKCYTRKDSSGFQIQLSKLNSDDDKFIKFRKLIYENDYIVFIKLKDKLEFICLGLKKEISTKITELYGVDENILYLGALSSVTSIDNSDVLEEKSDTQDLERKRNLPYQKIVYGAPGTGKSYGLAKEVRVEFPNFINPINEFNISENNEKIWLVGATWGNLNKYPEFIEENKWINGYDSGSDFQRAEKMSIGDYIIIKTAYFTGMGNKIPTLEIKAIGKIKNIKVVGKEIEVEWLTKDLSKKIIGENFRATVHDISQKKDLVNKIFDNTGIFTKKTEEIKASQRVTFYDGYTYGQFVGAYKPVMYEKDNEEKEIGYEFVAGPLLKQVLNAYKYPKKDFVLVIEEINRAKADRIFGDVFQLLDRNSEGDSEYPILLSQEQDNYFKENLDGERYLETIGKKEGLYLPNNLYLWATMNSADQGVYPMDTAFKRRWDFDYISLNKNQREEEFLVEIDNKKYNWNDYRETLNDILGEQGVTEDRLISPYFLKVTDFDEYKVLKESSYVNKFLMYIFDDILKHNNRLKEALFTEKNFYKIFSKLQNGNQIYSTNFMDSLNERPKKVDDEKTEE